MPFVTSKMAPASPKMSPPLRAGRKWVKDAPKRPQEVHETGGTGTQNIQVPIPNVASTKMRSQMTFDAPSTAPRAHPDLILRVCGLRRAPAWPIRAQKGGHVGAPKCQN